MKESKCELLSQALDQLNSGVILLFADGQIVHTNSVAEDILAERSALYVANGFLRGRKKVTTLQIQEILEDLTANVGVLTSSAREVCLERGTDETDAIVGSFRLLRNHSFGRPVIALFITRRANSATPYSLTGLAQTYDLTRAETRTLEHIVCGSVIADAAKSCVVSKNTVKTHLQKIFEKTGTSRQTDLLRLVYEFRPPLRGAQEPCRL